MKAEYGGDPDFSQRPLFRTRKLNSSFIVKHTVRTNEREALRTDRRSATKIIFPLAADDLRLGGFSVFVEQEDFAQVLRGALGQGVPQRDIDADMEVLEALSRLPSLDPYLLRERLACLGRDVAPFYFDICEGDAAEVQAHVMKEIERLASPVSPIDMREAAPLAPRLADLILIDARSDSLEPLRQALRMSQTHFVEGVYGWKGFIYYQWTLSRLEPSFQPVARDIMQLELVNARPDEERVLARRRQCIVRNLFERIEAVRHAASAYEARFTALAETKDPDAFRAFLMEATDMFVETGEHLAAINHICSFWSYRFPKDAPRRLDVDIASDMLRDFVVSLNAEDGRKAA